MACFFLYAATSPGNMMGDSRVRWEVAKSVASGHLDIPRNTDLGAQGRDGKFYSFYGPGQSFLAAPMVWAGKAMAAVLPFKGYSDELGQFATSLLVLPLFGAGAVALLYLLVLDATTDRRTARWLAVILAIATMHWEYSVNTYEESQIAFFTLACLWAIQRFWQRGQTGCLLLAFAMMGASLTFRLSSAVVLIPIGLVGIIVDLAQCRQRRLARLSQWVAAGVVGLGPALAASGIYNYVRFGSPMETGYVPAHEAMGGIKLFSTPFLNGLGGLMVSPGKSVFLYNPVLLLSIIGFAAFWRSQRRLAIMVLAACGATVVFHSKYTFWSGDVAWGPRYLASVMGLCVLPIMPLMQRRMSFLIVPVVIVSIGVQMTSVPYNFVLEYFQDGRHGTIPDDYVWRWQESQLLCRFQNIGRDLAGNPNNNSIPPAHERPELSQTTFGPAQVQTVHTPNIFPFKARLAANGQKLARMLTWLFVAMLAALGATVVLWWRRIEADRSPLSGVAPDNEAQSPGAPR